MSAANRPTRRFEYGGRFHRIANKPITGHGPRVRLVPTHPALVEGRTIFPSTVVAPADSPRLLVSGTNQRKIGRIVSKGRWKGFPLYTLTLEERATCWPSARPCTSSASPRAIGIPISAPRSLR